MDYFKRFLRNLGLLIGIGLILLLFFPNIMSDVFNIYGAVFGLIALLILVVAALPNKKENNKQ